MATLYTNTFFEVVLQGLRTTGKQGAAANAPGEPLATTVTGLALDATGTLATAAVKTLFDANSPVQTWSYGFLWADQICYLQLVGATTSAVFKLAATQPLVIPGYQTVLGAAATTAITGGAEPAVETVSKLVLGNYSGSTLNYRLALVG